MVKISNADLEVSRELFGKAVEMYRKSGLNHCDAYDAACDYFENEGYRIKYSSYESWKTVSYRKQ